MRLALLLVVIAGCFYDESSPLPSDFGACPAPQGPAAPASAAVPTWYADVEPIVVAKCEGCHTSGGIGPFALSSYSQVAAVHEQVRDAVMARRMPPWQPDACCNHYRFDRSLSDAERDTLVRWLEHGFPAGDPVTAPATPPAQGLPRVDLHAEMAAAFTPTPKVGADELRCFLLDHEPIDRTRYITGFDFHPGVRAMVHHVIVFAIDESKIGELERRDGSDGRPGWDCYGEGSELQGDKHYIGGWQPGVLARVLPDGIGRELPARSRVYIQIHYDTGHGIQPDRSALDIMLEDHVDRVERGIPVGNPLWFAGDGMKIAAGDPDAEVWFAYDPTPLVTHGDSVEIHNVMIHMHELGSIGRVAVLRKDGSTDCLLNITRWDFHWLGDYYFETPVRVDPEDRVYVECHWDNTAGHQKIVNGVQQAPRDLHWGTDAEMCGAVLTYSVVAP
jgi:hypothetical protein